MGSYDAPVPRPLRLLLLAVAAALVLGPMVRDPRDDSYPLSTYPMFATDRGDRHEIATVVEVLDDGAIARLSPETIAGTDEVVLTAVTVDRALRAGDAAALCVEVASRLGPGRRVRVQSETHDIVELVAAGTAPSAVEIHAECVG